MATVGGAHPSHTLYMIPTTAADAEALGLLQAAAQKIADLAVLIWYMLEHVFCYLTSYDLDRVEHVFGNGVICLTHNYGKLSDLSKYVALQRNPPRIHQKVKEEASRLGFTIEEEAVVVPKPHNEGHCFGNTVHFLKTWLTTRDIRQIAADFYEGSPIVGALYQEVYANLYQSIHYSFVTDSLCHLIDDWSENALNEEKEKWKNQSIKAEALLLLDATADYLRKGFRPTNESYFNYVYKWMKDHHNLSLAGTLYASIREVDTHYKDERMRDWEHSVSALSDMGLEVKTTHHQAHQAKDVLETLKHLKTGSYEMSLPIYSLTGKLKGFHSIGLIITESGTCYLLESNLAIGVIKRTELVQTVGRLFTEYTGLDYTNTLEGERPSSWKRIANIIQERANPPKDLSMPYFGLLEVELSSTLKDSSSAA